MTSEPFTSFAEKMTFAYLAALRPGEGKDMALIEAVNKDCGESKRLGRLVGRLAAVFETAAAAPRSGRSAPRSAPPAPTRRPSAAVNELDPARAVLICEQVRRADSDALWAEVTAKLNTKGPLAPAGQAPERSRDFAAPEQAAGGGCPVDCESDQVRLW